MHPCWTHPWTNAEIRIILSFRQGGCPACPTKVGTIPEIHEVPPISVHRNVMEIAGTSVGGGAIARPVNQLQMLLYSAYGGWDG